MNPSPCDEQWKIGHMRERYLKLNYLRPSRRMSCIVMSFKVHKIEIFFGFNFEICIISLLVMSKY
jgi:hypothetical protein